MTAMTLPRQVQEYLDDIVAGGIVGAVGLIEDGGEVALASSGLMELGGRPMPTDAIVRIQSMTKAVTTVAALRLVEAGRLGLDDPVSEWLPELAAPRVLRTPTSDLDDTVELTRPITVRHLLTLTCGHGMEEGTPYHAGQVRLGVDAGPDPVSLPADDWLKALASLPLVHQPGDAWRYHHGFMLLGILLSRLTGRPLGEHLAGDVFGPLGMVDTAFWTADPSRLPAAYRIEEDGPVEAEPAGAGFYAADPGFDVSHSELVGTASDYLRFARMLRDGGTVDGQPYLSPDSVAEMTREQVPDAAKSPESMGADFWKGLGWGYGVAVETGPPHPGRFTWSGGYGTDFTVDPATGRITILMLQAEMGPAVFGPLFGFREVGL